MESHSRDSGLRWQRFHLSRRPLTQIDTCLRFTATPLKGVKYPGIPLPSTDPTVSPLTKSTTVNAIFRARNELTFVSK